jgi:hypothetical protein
MGFRQTCFLVVLVVTCALIGRPIGATENGATSFPVGVETVLTGLQPHPGNTTVYEYTCFYTANEFADANGKKLPIDFKLRVFATAFKLNHTWRGQLLGGHIHSYIAVPLVYQQIHLPVGKQTKYGVGNIDVVPFGVNYHKGIAHWYYEADFFAPGGGYDKADFLNVGQHYFSGGPVFGMTLLPNQGKTEISFRSTYLMNGENSATHYHSGNEFFTEFTVDHKLSNLVAVGVNGAVYQQTTDDRRFGARFENGFRGRDLQVGPQVRFPLGEHGGFAFKYFRDTFVQNRPRGNAFWFQIAVPVRALSASRH